MAEFINSVDLDDDSLKNTMSNNESKMDSEIIDAIEKFKQKVKLENGDEFEHNLVVMDDMMLAVGSRKKIMQYVEELVMQKCHHENINYIFVVQDLMFSISKFRMLFSNANYIVLFPNKSDSRNAKHVLRSRGFNVKEITEILKQAFENQETSHPYLLLDSTVKVVENARIRQGIFPNEYLFVYNKITE